MKESITSKTRIAIGIGCIAAVSTLVFAHQKKAASLDARSFESNVNGAFSEKDAKRFGEVLASTYNEGGVSKEEALRQFSSLTEKANVQVRYHVVEFHEFPGGKRGYLKTTTEMTVNSDNGGAKTLKTAGFASLTREEGGWKLVATQPAGCPHVQNLDLTAERGDWEGFGSQVNPAGLAGSILPEDARPKFTMIGSDTGRAPSALAFGFQAPEGSPKFDKDAWERRFVHAWTSKSAQEIVSFYAAEYNELGFDRATVTQAVRQTVARYDKIECKYRVLGIKYFPGGHLASLKAVLDLQGQEKGSSSMTPIAQTAGYASLVADGDGWKIYATQLFATPNVEPTALKGVTASTWPPRLETSISR